MKSRILLIVTLSCLIVSVFTGPVTAADSVEEKLQSVLDRFVDDNPSVPGVMLALDSERLDLHFNGAAGIDDRNSGKAISPDQPLRLASTTKTYVAAAILRLMELGRLGLDDSLDRHLPMSQLEMLTRGGYDPAAITIRHLLTHTSGLWDYALSDSYAEAVSAAPDHRWTRNEQLQYAMDRGKPHGPPGRHYRYADTGYILLGEIIEQRNESAFAAALRELLRFEKLGLSATWLETLEPDPPSAPARVHQYWGETDTLNWDPSLDLYGGGGLVANMPDLARFFQALFAGQIFDSPKTLATMRTSLVPDHGGPWSNKTGYGGYQYCMGIYVGQYRGFTIYQHGGFWGTRGVYVPALDLALGLAVNQQQSREPQQKLFEALLDVVIDSPEASQLKDRELFDLRAHYDKSEHKIPMRDGVTLFTAVYTPKDKSRTYPILLNRTPYSIRAYGDEYPALNRMAPSEAFVEDGYIFVHQDIRGTFMSEGEFEVIKSIRADKSDPTAVDESTDAFDTIEWLINNVDNHNGRVGQWGVSYMGWTTVMGMIDAHPALVASSPQASPSDMFIGDDWHHNGAFRLMYSFYWMAMAARSRETPTQDAPEPFDYDGTPWGYKFFMNSGPASELNNKYFSGKIPGWEDFINHPDYDEFWQRQQALPYLDHIKHPILNVAAWFDAEDFYGPVSIYQEIEKRNPINQSTFVSGPWYHGGWVLSDGRSLGDIDFGSNTSDWYKENVVFPFFQHYLKDEGEWNAPEAVVFETGGNRWHQFADWPPTGIQSRNLYFQSGGVLSYEKPTDRRASDNYVSDPRKPVPFSTDITTKPGHTWMIEDQRLVSTRPDVLVYQTPVLTEDLTIAGPIVVRLFVSTDGTDADYFVKLIDVFPGDTQDPDPNPKEVVMGDYQMLLGVEAMRARYRDSFSDPSALIRNRVTPINFTIWDKFHTFKKGHRLMVQVHSTWFPAYDRNPQQFIDIYHAAAKDLRVAEQRIHRQNNAASHLVLPVLQLSAED